MMQYSRFEIPSQPSDRTKDLRINFKRLENIEKQLSLEESLQNEKMVTKKCPLSCFEKKDPYEAAVKSIQNIILSPTYSKEKLEKNLLNVLRYAQKRRNGDNSITPEDKEAVSFLRYHPTIKIDFFALCEKQEESRLSYFFRKKDELKYGREAEKLKNNLKLIIETCEKFVSDNPPKYTTKEITPFQPSLSSGCLKSPFMFFSRAV